MKWNASLYDNKHDFVSKYGEGPGWQLRVTGNTNTPCWTVRGSGNADMSSTIGAVDKNNWHFYAGTYDSVLGIRNLYVDGVLAAQQTNEVAYNMAPAEHLTIGGKDSPSGNVFGNYFTGEIYNVQIYNTALSQAQVNSFIPPVPPPTATPAFSGKPIINGNKLVLSWTGGTLLQATNLTGPWIPAPGATSPYTNDITTAPRLFFRVSNP